MAHWTIVLVSAAVALGGFGFAKATFDREMDEDIRSLETRLAETKLDGEQTKMIGAAFRSTHYNVRNFMQTVCFALTAAIVVVSVGAAVVVRRYKPAES